jgi:hypothetical protein
MAKAKVFDPTVANADFSKVVIIELLDHSPVNTVLSDLPIATQTIVRRHGKDGLVSPMHVAHLADIIGFVKFETPKSVIALNPNIPYKVTDIADGNKSNTGPLTQVSWRINHVDKVVLLNEPMMTVLEKLPAAAQRHQRKASAAQGFFPPRPARVRGKSVVSNPALTADT